MASAGRGARLTTATETVVAALSPNVTGRLARDAVTRHGLDDHPLVGSVGADEPATPVSVRHVHDRRAVATLAEQDEALNDVVAVDPFVGGFDDDDVAGPQGPELQVFGVGVVSGAPAWRSFNPADPRMLKPLSHELANPAGARIVRRPSCHRRNGQRPLSPLLEGTPPLAPVTQPPGRKDSDPKRTRDGHRSEQGSDG